MPLGLTSVPFIVKHGDHILFSLTWTLVTKTVRQFVSTALWDTSEPTPSLSSRAWFPERLVLGWFSPN